MAFRLLAFFSYKYWRSVIRIIKDLYQIVKELKRLRAATPANEVEKNQQQVIMKRYDQQARIFITHVICLEAWLFDEGTCKSSTNQVASFSMVLMKLLTGKVSVAPEEVPTVPPSSWSAFPECLIEDLTDFVIFVR